MAKPIKLEVSRHENLIVVYVLCEGEQVGTVRIPPLGGPGQWQVVADELTKRLGDINRYVVRAADRIASRKPTTEMGGDDE